MDEVEDTVTGTEENPAPEETIEGGEKPPEEKPKKPWYEKRFDRFTAQNQALSREKQALLEENIALKAGKLPEVAIPPEKISELVEKEIAAREFNAKCNSIYEDGSDKYDDFDRAVKSLGTMGLMTPPFLELVTDLDNGTDILYHLGNNQEEADRISSLPPAKQALALAKLETSLKAPKEKESIVEPKVSKAPPPIETVEKSTAKSGAGYGTKYYEGMSQEEFNAWDDKNSRKRR